jgi:hypothetical protein
VGQVREVGVVVIKYWLNVVGVETPWSVWDAARCWQDQPRGGVALVIFTGIDESGEGVPRALAAAVAAA